MCTKSMKPLKVTYRPIQSLTGQLNRRIERISDGSIITRFNKTPLPKKPNDVVCPHFLEFKWANGCNFDCSWCYLNGTFRFSGGKRPKLKSLPKIWRHLYTFLNAESPPELLNAGELSDSLLFENNDVQWTIQLNKQIDRFNGHSSHKILYVTKDTRISGLLKIDRPDRFIISFSLNALPVAKRWERAPRPTSRIRAAKKLAKKGYQIRIRIDPIVPIPNWQKAYENLLELIFSNLVPERVTLGSLRGLASTIANCPDRTWVKFLDESSNWGKKVEFETRKEIYKVILDSLESQYGYSSIALCKETISMWQALGLNYKNIRCNCLL